MSYSRKPKFKVGVTVDIRPYDDFTEHIAIPEWYWNKMNANNPHIISVVIPGQHSAEGQVEMVEDIYYSLGDGYSYSEEFLMEHFEFLPDDLFEV